MPTIILKRVGSNASRLTYNPTRWGGFPPLA